MSELIYWTAQLIMDIVFWAWLIHKVFEDRQLSKDTYTIIAIAKDKEGLQWSRTFRGAHMSIESMDRKTTVGPDDIYGFNKAEERLREGNCPRCGERYAVPIDDPVEMCLKCRPEKALDDIKESVRLSMYPRDEERGNTTEEAVIEIEDILEESGRSLIVTAVTPEGEEIPLEPGDILSTDPGKLCLLCYGSGTIHDPLGIGLEDVTCPKCNGKGRVKE